MIKRQTIHIGDRLVVLQLDEDGTPGYGGSSIDVHDPAGCTESIPIPSIREDGVPGLGGRTPTFEDLVQLAMLRIEMWPILRRLADQGAARLAAVARAVGETPPVNDGTFEWLLIMRRAVEMGILTLDGDDNRSSPLPH